MPKVISSFSDFDFQENRSVYIRYDDYTSFLDDCDWCDEGIMPNHLRKSIAGGSSFSGTESLSEALTLARTGWGDGLKRVDFSNISTDIREKAKGNTIDIEFGKSGQYIDMGKYLSGEPNCMVNSVVAFRPKMINIIIKCTYSAANNEDSLFAFGQRVVNIIDNCEKNNIRTNIIVRESVSPTHDVFFGSPDSEQGLFVCDVNIKKFHEFIDLNKLAFTLCHLSFNRRLMFSIQEKQSCLVGQYFGFNANSGYGRPSEIVATQEEMKNSLCIDSIQDTDNKLMSDAITNLTKDKK